MLIIQKIPALLCAVCISLYWTIVFIKTRLITRKIGKAPNVIPKEWMGFLSRLIMLPLIVAWIYVPWCAFFTQTPVVSSLAWIGAFLALVALGLSCYCWHHMGQTWRLGIDPKEINPLITDGPFKSIRHPIYSLSMILVLGCLLAVQTQMMLVVFCIHWALFILESLREERYLHKVHGETYATYVQDTNRFLPRF